MRIKDAWYHHRHTFRQVVNVVCVSLFQFRSRAHAFAEGFLTKVKVCESFCEYLERFSIECYKTQAKAVTLANHKERRKSNEPIKIQGKDV